MRHNDAMSYSIDVELESPRELLKLALLSKLLH